MQELRKSGDMVDNLLAQTLAAGRKSELPEITLIDEIDDLARDYARRHGTEPIYVSHWDPSEEVIAKLAGLFPEFPRRSPVPYTFSYLLKRRPKHWPRILEGLGFSEAVIARGDVAAQAFENGTSSISAVANWLKVVGIKRVVLLSPYYFAVPYNLRRLGLTVREVYLPRINGQYALPSDLKIDPSEALWVTHPVYNTGVYSLEDSVSKLISIADNGSVVVADESLGVPPSRLASALGGHQNFIGVYTPHKAICMNGMKFSMVVYHPGTGDTFDHWSDILSGGLSLSAIAATEHFVRPEFTTYRDRFWEILDETRAWHSGIISKYSNILSTDVGARGHFLSVYVPALRAELGNDLLFLREMLERTRCTVIPGIRSGFDPASGFSFRVCLAQDSAKFRGALESLYGYLANLVTTEESSRYESSQARL
jgi:histidinol-phosphate/aromatic aminotransferase/cobyric acid decarboxylase-like protein